MSHRIIYNNDQLFGFIFILVKHKYPNFKFLVKNQPGMLILENQINEIK